MRLLVVSAVAAMALTSCGGTDPPEIDACADGESAPTPPAAPAPREPFMGILHATANSPAVLARFDPLSLSPVSRQVEVGEYHDAWSLSPDGSQLALARGGQGIGIAIVDLASMKLVRQAHTGIAAEALAWLAPHRLVAGLQRGGTVIVDPRTGRIMRRWPGFSFPDAAVPTRGGLVMLLPRLRRSASHLPLTRVAGAPRLAVVEARGRLRSVTLERIRLAVGSSGGVYYEDRAGLAVDRARARAYVAAAGAPVAEVDLRTMRVSYHLELPGPDVEGKDAPARQRHALWLAGGRIAVFGRELAGADGRNLTAKPAGVTLIDTNDWSACMLDQRASRAAVAADRLLIYGPGPPVSRDDAGVGLRGYVVGRGEAFRLFEGEQVWNVEVAADHAYVQTANAVHVVGLRSGKVFATIARPLEVADVITGTS
jgi:hypothetical protein